MQTASAIRLKQGPGTYLVIDLVVVSEQKYLVFIIQSQDPSSLQTYLTVQLQSLQYPKLVQSYEDFEKARANMLSSMVHEMRQPLNCSIIMQEQLLKLLMKDNMEVCNKLLFPSISSSKLLLNYINDILDYSQINAGKFSCLFTKCNLFDIVKETLNLIYIQASLKGIRLHFTYETGLPKNIYTDPNRLRQILLNLLSNSIKFTKQGSITTIIRKASKEG